MKNTIPKLKIVKIPLTHSFTNITFRSWPKVSFSLNEKVFNFTPIERLLHRLYKHVGRPPYSKLPLFKVVLLQRFESWQFDTVLVKKGIEVKDYSRSYEFRKRKTPSNDTTSRLRRILLIKLIEKTFFKLDTAFSALRTFEKDDFAILAVEITINSNYFKRTDSW